MVSTGFRLPDEEEQADEVFFRQLEEASQLQALVPVGDLNHAGIYWKGKMTRHKKYMRLLDHIEDDFLTQSTS